MTSTQGLSELQNPNDHEVQAISHLDASSPEDEIRPNAQAGDYDEDEHDGDHEQPANKVLDLESFPSSIGNRPLFTRKLLNNIAAQVDLAQEGRNVELTDCYGENSNVHTEECLIRGYVFHETGKPPITNI
jgi:hypothetical protein